MYYEFNVYLGTLLKKKMATREASKCVTKTVRPLLSSDRLEAKKRVLNLYKTYYRQIPLICKWFIVYLSKISYNKLLFYFSIWSSSTCNKRRMPTKVKIWILKK